MSTSSNKVISIHICDFFSTLSWWKCWKCACGSMSLASFSSTAFSLQTERTFLERNNVETEEIKPILTILMETNTVILYFTDLAIIKRLQIYMISIHKDCWIPEKVLYLLSVKFICIAVDLTQLKVVCLWMSRVALAWYLYFKNLKKPCD